MVSLHPINFTISENKNVKYDKSTTIDNSYEYDEFTKEINEILYIEKNKFLVSERTSINTSLDTSINTSLDTSINTSLDTSINTSLDTSIIYRFLEAKPFNSGTYTCVYKIKKIKPYNKKIFVLRVFEYSDNLLEKYTLEKKIFGHNIIKIYHCGKIRDKAGVICNYIITDLYHDRFDIIKLNSTEKINLYGQILTLINKAKRYNYFLRDLKLANIGYKKRYNKLILVILDYDKDTFIKYDTLKKEKIRNRYIYGTYLHPAILLMLCNSSVCFRDLSYTKIIVNKLYKIALIEILLLMFSKMFYETYNIKVNSIMHNIYNLCNTHFADINVKNKQKYINSYNKLISQINIPYIENFYLHC
jgi:hypothetical protein